MREKKNSKSFCTNLKISFEKKILVNIFSQNAQCTVLQKERAIRDRWSMSQGKIFKKTLSYMTEDSSIVQKFRLVETIYCIIQVDHLTQIRHSKRTKTVSKIVSSTFTFMCIQDIRDMSILVVLPGSRKQLKYIQYVFLR